MKHLQQVITESKKLLERFTLVGIKNKTGAEPEESDITIDDQHGLQAFSNGKLIAKAPAGEYDDIADQLADWMKHKNFYPSIWLGGERSNYELQQIKRK